MDRHRFGQASEIPMALEVAAQSRLDGEWRRSYCFLVIPAAMGECLASDSSKSFFAES
jgi:hypothetical protein